MSICFSSWGNLPHSRVIGECPVPMTALFVASCSVTERLPPASEYNTTRHERARHVLLPGIVVTSDNTGGTTAAAQHMKDTPILISWWCWWVMYRYQSMTRMGTLKTCSTARTGLNIPHVSYATMLWNINTVCSSIFNLNCFYKNRDAKWYRYTIHTPQISTHNQPRTTNHTHQRKNHTNAQKSRSIYGRNGRT